MKNLPSIKAFLALIAIIIINILTANVIDGNKKVYNSDTIIANNNKIIVSNIEYKRLDNELLAINEEKEEKKEVPKKEEPKIVYDGMTMDELGAKLNRNLKSTLKGYGKIFAEYSIKYDVDPYIALAIVLHETGCNSGKCSTLTSKCNNIGGMKGSPTCGLGAYKRFNTLDEGIKAFYKNLSKNYFKKGLTTPEKIGKKYAESETWPQKIRYYVQIIRKS